MKRIISLLLILISLLGLSSCIFNRENPYPYRGEYKDLYTTAIYSIPDAEGYMHHGEGASNPDIYIWEQDDYGRTLFSYCEDYYNQVFALVISQASDETNVYFYSDNNYALTFIDSEHLYKRTDDHLKKKTENLYMESKDELKEKNDWNKPIDKSKCVSYPITDHKILGENIYSLNKAQCNEILNEYTKTLNLPNPEKHPHRYNSVLQIDAAGKVLHEIHGTHRYYDNPDWENINAEFTWYDITLWVITENNGNYDKENGVMVMYSKANESDGFVYNADDILEFKNKNGWKN